MKSRKVQFSVLSICVSALLHSGGARANGMLQALQENGQPDTAFGSGGHVFTSGAGDYFTSIFVSTSIVIGGGAIDVGAGRTRAGMWRYLRDTGAVDSSWGTNGVVTVPSPVSTQPKQYVQAVVRNGSLYTALCGDGTNVWLARFDANGELDGDFGWQGIVFPFGPVQNYLTPVGMQFTSDGNLIVVAQNVVQNAHRQTVHDHNAHWQN